MVSARIYELSKAIEDVLEFEAKNKLSNNPLIMKNDRNFK